MIARLRRSRRADVAELNITAFMNLMVALVPFLLITAVFTQLAVKNLDLPDPSQPPPAEPPSPGLVLVIRASGLRLLNGSAAIGEWPRQTDYAFDAVTEALVALKASQPQEERITLLLEPDIPYDILIRAMDAVHYQPPQDARSLIRDELFPKISVGDAPAAGAP